MSELPVYSTYGGEKKIALLDNSAIAFMQQLDLRELEPDILLKEAVSLFRNNGFRSSGTEVLSHKNIHHICEDYVYESDIHDRNALKRDVFDNENGYIRLVLEGEDRLEYNQNIRCLDGKVIDLQ